MIPSYPKSRSKVTLPTRHNPGRGRPEEFLAYLTPEEMEMLRRLTDGTVERGPLGVPSFADDSASSKGVSRGDSSGTKGSGSSPSGSGSKSNTSSGGSYGGGGKMGSGSSQSGGTKSGSDGSGGSSGTGTGGKGNSSGPGGGMMGGSGSGGPSRTNGSTGSSGNGTGGKGNSSGPGGGMMGGSQSGGPSRTSPSSGNPGTGGGGGNNSGAGRDSSRGLGQGAGGEAVGRVPGSAGIGNGGGQSVDRAAKGDFGPAVTGALKTDVGGVQTVSTAPKQDMSQYVNRVEKTDLPGVQRMAKTNMDQYADRIAKGDLTATPKNDLPAGVTYTAAAPSGVYGPRAQPPGTGYLNNLSNLGTPPSLAGSLKESYPGAAYANVENGVIGSRSPKGDLQKPSRVADVIGSTAPPVGSPAGMSFNGPPVAPARSTALTRGVDPYNVKPANGGALVDAHQFSKDYNPLSSVQAPTQRVNTAGKTDLPGRATYGGYGFDQSSALQAAAIDRGLVGSINAGIDATPEPGRRAASVTPQGDIADPFKDRYAGMYDSYRDQLSGLTAQGAGPKFRDAEGLMEVDVPGYPASNQKPAAMVGGLGVTAYNSGIPGAISTNAGNMTTKSRDKFYGGGPTAENILSIESYPENSFDGPDVPPSENPSQEGWWGGPSGDVPPSQREPLIDENSWQNRARKGAFRLGNAILPGLGTGMNYAVDRDIDKINQMSPAEQAALKEKWARENAAYLRGDIGPGRGGQFGSGVGGLKLGSRNGYIPPASPPPVDTGTGGGTTPPPASGGQPTGWNRKRIGNPLDPYNYGYGQEYNYFSYS